jgi:type I restriction enzyme, S subunit
LSNLPPNWVEVKLGDVVEHFKDRIPDRSKWTFDRYIGGEHFDEGAIRVTKSNPIEGNEEIIGSAFHMRFKPGDVLYVTRNPRLRKGGIVDFEGVCSNVTFTLRAKEDRLLQTLLPFIIQTENFVMHTTNNAHGSTNPFLNWKDIAKYKLLLPPINEQKKISDILWSIEETQIKLENLIEVTEKFKKELLEELLTKGIGHKKFKNSDLGKIPEEWNVGTLSDYCEIIMGQSPPSSSYNSKKDGLPFIQGKTEFGKINPILTTFTNAPAKIAERGDLLFTVRAPVGAMNWCDDKTCIGRGIAAFRSKNNTNPHFLYFILEKMNYELNRLSQGSTFTAITGKELKDFSVPKVPTNEQNIIGNLLLLCDQQIDNFSKHFSKLTQLKKKLTNEFLSGNLLIPTEVLN